MARLYTLQRYDLRKLAEEPVQFRRHDDDNIDWRHGLLALLAFCAMLAWLDEMDNAAEYRKAAEKAHQAAQEARQELQSEREADSIKWVGKGFECRFRVEKVWHSVFRRECERLGSMIADARVE